MIKYLTWVALAALAYPPVTAGWTRFMRKQAYWTMLAFGLGRRKAWAA